MVIAPPTTAKIFDLSKVTYLNGKNSDQISQAAAVEQPSHAEMVKLVTGFIDNLIQSGVDKLETAARDSSNREAQSTAAINLDRYNADTTVASFKSDVASGLAKNIYAVKQFLIEGGLAEHKNNQELTFKAKGSVDGGKIADESAQELAQQALKSVQDKLSAYGININTSEATVLALRDKITGELKKPPEAKSETPEVTTQAVTETTSDTSQSDKAPTAGDIENFFKNIQQASPVLANLSQSRKGLEVLSERISSISEEVGVGAVDQATLEKFQNNIFPKLADEKKFTDAVSELSQGEKATLKTILCAVHGQADKDITCNEMSVHAQNINKNLGTNSTSLENINNGIDGLIQSHQPSDATPDKLPDLANLKKVNQLLVTFKEELTKANKLSSTADKVTAREKAQTKLLSGLKSSLETNLIDVADLKMLKEVLAKPDSANSNYNERANKFLKDLNISTDDLKQWGSMTAMLAVGLIIFCPRAITGVMQAGTGLLNMTLGNGMLPMLLMNGFGGDTKQGMNPIAAMMMMRNNNQGSKAA
jgi:hypothetical protein